MTGKLIIIRKDGTRRVLAGDFNIITEEGNRSIFFDPASIRWDTIPDVQPDEHQAFQMWDLGYANLQGSELVYDLRVERDPNSA